MTQQIQILSMGKYLPPRKVSAEELEEKMGLKPGWILKRSGVQTRHFIGPEESVSDMGAKALTKALEKAQLKYEDLDLIINASASYDYPIPENSCMIQKAMGKGMSGIPSFTIDTTCLSFVVALDTAACLIACGRYKTIAIVTAEVASKSLNYNEKESATLLGDGAAAAILQPTPEGEPSQLLSARLETYADGALHTYVKVGGHIHHPKEPETNNDEAAFHMNGPAVMKLAFKKLAPFIESAFEPLDFNLQDVDLFVPHQASKAALSKVQHYLKLSDAQFVNYLENHGNCVAASIPMALHDAIEEGRLKRGDRLCLLGTGAGLSIGTVILNY